MKKKGVENGLLKDIKKNDSFSDEEYLQSNIEEDRELEIIVNQRENQEEIVIDIDDL
tara:strand:+ start:6908 stop:7078 length:171 start_codon:yes stop_codon:yes gene_type:complete